MTQNTTKSIYDILDELVPNGVLFNLLEVQEMKAIRIATAKKLINAGKIEAIKIGNKLHISRAELIRYLEDRTLKVSK